MSPNETGFAFSPESYVYAAKESGKRRRYTVRARDLLIPARYVRQFFNGEITAAEVRKIARKTRKEASK